MLKIKSPAKINLFLRVLHRREDQFHEIASLFQAISLFDHLTFKLHEKDEFFTNDSSLPLDERNLVIKARELFRKKTGILNPIKIGLEKNIPSSAGLGGGSGNAATTLYALNQLFQSQIPNEKLAVWSSEIGSDIPFFFSTGLAYCTGRGEKIQSIDQKLDLKLVLAKPDFGLSTPAVFKSFQVANSSQICPEALLQKWLADEPIYINDLEKPAFAISPLLQHFKDTFQSIGKLPVLMTGSGTTFFSMENFTVDYPEGYQKVSSIHRLEDSWY